MCLLRGLLLPIIFLVFLLPVILFMSLGRSWVSWRNRDKNNRNSSRNRNTDETQQTYSGYDTKEVIDPSKIEYIDFEEVEKDEKP